MARRIHSRVWRGLLLATALGWGVGNIGGNDPPPVPGVPGDPDAFAVSPPSCAMTCPDELCAERDHPYVCPAANAWASIPHAASCPSWDGTYPAAANGQCTASQPTGDAAKYAGTDPDDPSTLILPDGRRVHAAGTEWIWDEPDAPGHVTTGIVAIPNTSFVLTLDDGVQPAPVRAIDTSKMISGGPSPVVGRMASRAFEGSRRLDVSAEAGCRPG